MSKTYISWDQFHKDCDILGAKVSVQLPKIDYIIGLSRGGVVPARIVAESVNADNFLILGLKLFDNDKRGDKITLTQNLPDIEFDRHDKILIVDDISDKGTTLQYAYKHIFKLTGGARIFTACPYMKPGTQFTPTFYTKVYKDDQWIVFPFEK